MGAGMRYRRWRVAGGTYFFTLVTRDRAPLLVSDGAVAAWRRAVEAVGARRPFVVEAEVVLPDHIHTIWALPDGDDDFPTRMRLVKRAATIELGAQLPGVLARVRGRKGERPVWQPRYWEHLIRDEADFDGHLDYIHANPVRHGLAATPLDWPHSSFRRWMAAGRYDAWWGAEQSPPLPAWAVSRGARP